MFYSKITIVIIYGSLIKSEALHMKNRIVNGEYASIQQFPHSAFLSISCAKRHDTEFFSCGSSIINQLIILTAGHCIEGCLEGRTFIGISVGSEHKKKGAVHRATKFTVHPDYDSTNIINDIALVRSKTPFKFNSRVKRVALMKDPPQDKQAVLAGWGRINEYTKENTLYLKWAKQQIQSTRDCSVLFKRMARGTICAGVSDSKVGHAAGGDSGSALTVRDYIQVGLVSYKVPQISRTIVVYTDVAYFYHWIMDNAKRLYCRGA